jgi:hypothetical protein
MPDAALSFDAVDLRLENNLLTGTIPPEIESLHRLEYVKMGKNALAGSLPDVFDRLHYLGKTAVVCNLEIIARPQTVLSADCIQVVELDLHKNEIVGTLPASLGKSTTLGKSFTDFITVARPMIRSQACL